MHEDGDAQQESERTTVQLLVNAFGDVCLLYPTRSVGPSVSLARTVNSVRGDGVQLIFKNEPGLH